MDKKNNSKLDSGRRWNEEEKKMKRGGEKRKKRGWGWKRRVEEKKIYERSGKEDEMRMKRKRRWDEDKIWFETIPVRKMQNVFRLRLGALLHFLIAVGHLICLFFLEDAFRAYGILDEMKHLCFGQEWLLYVVTVCLAAGFTIAGFYALAAAGDIRKLPLRRLVMIAIVGLYSIRVIVGIGWLLYAFTYLQFFSTLVPAFLVYCYLPGLKRDVNNQMLP